MTDIFTLERGDAPLIISIPHLGTRIPDALRSRYTDVTLSVADTDGIWIAYTLSQSHWARRCSARASRAM